MGTESFLKNNSQQDREVSAYDKSDKPEKNSVLIQKDDLNQRTGDSKVTARQSHSITEPFVYIPETEIEFSLCTWHLLLQLQAKAREDWGKIQS